MIRIRIYNNLRGHKLDSRISDAFSQMYRTQNTSNKSVQDDSSILYQVKKNGEYEEIRNKYIDTDQWMKAPNGKPTNLTEEQWITVRTPSFKRWFGDWELISKLNMLLRSEPVSILSEDIFSKEGNSDLVSMVNEYYSSFGNKVYREGIGNILLSRHNIQSSIAHGIGRKKAIAFKAVPEVIKKGLIFKETNNYKERGYLSIVIDAPIRIASDDYICEVVINKKENSNDFYLHEVELKEKLQLDNQVRTYRKKDSMRNAKAGASRLILSRLIADDNITSSKVLDSNGEPLMVYHGTDSDFNVFDKTKSRANMDIQGNFFSPNKSDASDYGENVRAFFLNLRNPADESTAFNAFQKYKGQNNAGIKAREYLQSLGYDGENNSNEEFIAFEANQIKSATDNIGTFDSDNPSILFQSDIDDDEVIDDYDDPYWDSINEEIDEAEESIEVRADKTITELKCS